MISIVTWKREGPAITALLVVMFVYIFVGPLVAAWRLGRSQRAGETDVEMRAREAG